MKGFWVGLGVGVGLGMIFAPMRGEDIRELAAVRASELADKTQEQYGRAREVADKAVSAVRHVREDRATGTEG
jgi:gas vesicle protein